MKIEDAPVDGTDLKGKDLVLTCLPEDKVNKQSLKDLRSDLESGEAYITKNVRPGNLRKLMGPKMRKITEFVKRGRTFKYF